MEQSGYRAHLEAAGTQKDRSYVHSNIAVPLLGFTAFAIAVLAVHPQAHSGLDTLLDTSVFLLSGMLALMLSSSNQRAKDALLSSLAVCFISISCFEFLHALCGIAWSGPLEAIARAREALWPATWLSAAYLFPIGVLCSIGFARHGRKGVLGLGSALLLIGVTLSAVSYWLPRYTAPGSFSTTSLLLLPVPFLCAGLAATCWWLRAADRIFPTILVMAGVLAVTHMAMSYSRAPHDALAIAAHLGKAGAYLFALLTLAQMASDDTTDRVRAEELLARLNTQLEERVLTRTAELQSSQQRLAIQLDRLHLLDQITRAIGERQDLRRIYLVVLCQLEEHLPIDFGCICSYEKNPGTLRVICVGEHSEALAQQIAMKEGESVRVGEDVLTSCISGKLIYEPNLDRIESGLTQRFVRAGLRSLVLAPLVADSRVCGVLVAARRAEGEFSSPDCEFLRQLSEHVALAAGQVQTRAALQLAYDELRMTTRTVMQQERLRALGQMASGIAHDINNALSPVGLYTELLLEREPSLSERARHYLETINRAIDDVGQTVARMREFYRPREAQMVLAPVDLNVVIMQVVDLTRARWSDLPQQRGIVISISTELSTDLPPIQGAAAEIRDALTNLVFNAVDAMPGGGTLNLRTLLRRAQAGDTDTTTRVCIEVCDSGVGMDEETRRRCVEPFFTTKGERGTGLGLASVYGMIERHSGALEIESEPQHGTTVRLLIPVFDAVPAPQTTAPPSSWQPLRILTVDDDPIIIDTLRNILHSEGHRVTTADGGQAGIDSFTDALRRGERFDIVITDLGMPHVDGCKVAAAIGALSPRTPIILLTGWGQRLRDDSELPPCVHKIVPKPPRLSELRSALSELTADLRVV